MIVKTRHGGKSGVTHAGGRYINRSNPYSTTVISIMRDQGIEPPPMPFIVSGASDLCHEWGHHVDLCWSHGEYKATFSTRWFSHFYAIRDASVFINEKHKGDSETEAAAAILANEWHLIASELFANLFDDWMRDKYDIGWDDCEPRILNLMSSRNGHNRPLHFSSAHMREAAVSPSSLVVGPRSW